MATRTYLLVRSEPRADERLSVCEVRERRKTPHLCVLSTGELLFIYTQKLLTLCEALCQEQAAVRISRTWPTQHGEELVEIHRVENPDWTPTPKGARLVF